MNDNQPLEDSLDKRALEILEYWFGTSQDDAEVGREKAELWWGHAPETDAEIERRFEPLIEAAGRGELESWTDSARGRLAVILLLDQFTRNVYRDSSGMYAHDEKAVRLTQEGVQMGLLPRLRPIERVFFLLPLEHAEDLALQKSMVEHCKDLVREVPEAWRETFENYLSYARAHYDVVERFGRFPHRNEILGRSSTPEEVEFLEQPGSSF